MLVMTIIQISRQQEQAHLLAAGECRQACRLAEIQTVSYTIEAAT